MSTRTQTLGSDLTVRRTHRKPHRPSSYVEALLYLLVSAHRIFVLCTVWLELSELAQGSFRGNDVAAPGLSQGGQVVQLRRGVPCGRPLRSFSKTRSWWSFFATIGSVVSTILVGFGFSRKRFPGRDLLFYVLAEHDDAAGEVTLIPQFLMFKSFGWLDTLYPLDRAELLCRRV